MHNEPLRKILVIRLSSIGDVLLTTPFLRAVKRRYPECELHFIVRTEFEELLQWNPHVDRLVGIDVTSGRRGLEAVNHELLTEGYDAVFDLHDNFRSRLLANGLSSHEHRMNKRKIVRFALVHLGVNLYRDMVPVPDRYIETAQKYGAEPDVLGPEFFLPEGTEQTVHIQMRSRGLDPTTRIVGLCPGSKHFTKQWPLESYEQLTSLILDAGLHVAVLGGSADAPAGSILQRLDPARVHSFCGDFSLPETASIMDHCAGIVANDSGLMHVASARRRPLVAIFGSTVREFGFYPYNSTAAVLEVDGLSCRPCSHIGRSRCPKKHFRCMRDITPAAVYNALHEMLGGAA